MTIVIPIHRALATKVAPRSFNVVSRWGYNPWLARVNSAFSDEHDIKSSQSGLGSRQIRAISTRTYATQSAAKPASRPKAHTGRTPAKRSTKTSTSSKPGPKTAVGKRAVGRKPKTKTRKATPAPKKKTTKKSAPAASTILKQRRTKEKELKEKALLNPPKQLPATPWAIVFAEAHKTASGFDKTGQRTKDASQRLKNLTPEEKEHYNHLANQNKAANAAAYQKWLSTHTPEQVREANNARNQLKRQYVEKHPKKKSVHKFSAIKDARLVVRPRSAYVFFTKDRHASGDFAHMRVAESARLIGREWKNLDSSEAKKYQDQQTADHNRYVEEYTSVYGEAPRERRRGQT